ncbi:MAG: ArnT family glycosyltransferase [Candidatus Saccharimonadia bacterium]
MDHPQLQLLRRLIKTYHYVIVGSLLALMFGLGVTSMAHDSAIVDEVAHIPAGYSYLEYGDYRLNPEHPPLIKDIAALPLTFMHLSFPITSPSWTSEINGEWDSGWNFLYYAGNSPTQILFYARLPILILSIVFAAVFYELLRRKFGIGVGLLAVFLYTLEPNIMAHSRLVTTDIGVTALCFLAVWTFVLYLEKPDLMRGGVATLCLALAQLAKFSAVVLGPLYIFLVLVVVAGWGEPTKWWSRAKTYFLGLLGIGVGALVLIWLFYFPMTLHMPNSVQKTLVASSLWPGWKMSLAIKLATYNHIPGMRALVQYVLGVAMVLGRVAGGNTTYLLGHVTNQSFWWYFPITYLIKTPVALLIMIVIVSVYGVLDYFHHAPKRLWENFRRYSKERPMQFAALSFVGLYSLVSMTGNLNLGIRHLLPMFPFIFLTVSIGMVGLLRRYPRSIFPSIGLGLLMLWYLAANLLIYPSYIAYFNELIGGPNNAYKYVTDSSIDWGQDLARLHDYVASNHISHIAVDYFGGGLPQYYFCSANVVPKGSIVNGNRAYNCSGSPFIEWHSSYGLYHGYMAVSETYLENDIYYSGLRGDSGYDQLRKMTPIAKIGYSIYVYKLN